MFAEAFYRRDEFPEGGRTVLNGVDVEFNHELIIAQYPTLNVAKLESFKGQTPYDLRGRGRSRCG